MTKDAPQPSDTPDEPNEKSAMISRLSTAYNGHGAVDVPDESIPRRGWIQGKFTQVYLLLCVVSLFVIATFVVLLVLTLRLSEMGHKYDDMSKSADQGLRSITNLFTANEGEAIGGRTREEIGSGTEHRETDYANHPRAGAVKTVQEQEQHLWEDTRQEVRPPAAAYPPLPPTSAPLAAVQLPPGVDPALFRPENLSNLLKLAAALHIDLNKLPKEYQDLLPKPINATIHRKSGEGAPTDGEERVIQKAPKHAAAIPDEQDYWTDGAENISEAHSMSVEKKSGDAKSSLTVEATAAADSSTPAVNALPVGQADRILEQDSNDVHSAAKVEEHFGNVSPDALKVKASTTLTDSRQYHAFPSGDREEKSSGKWRDASCSSHGKCEKRDFSTPPLLVISIDGFAHDYLKLKLTPVLDRMADCGATSEFVYPSYPSKTFPNHFTMVTGVWPATHGIVDNAIYDTTISKNLESMKKNWANHSDYFRAEPIWSSYARVTGKKAACLFWVGCQHNITQHNPEYNLPYQKDMSFEERVEKIVNWLSLPPASRPGLITAYFHQLDTAAHWEKSPQETRDALKGVDAAITSLFDQLEERDILECVNIVVVSDHGMQKLTRRVYFDDHFSSDGLVIAKGVIGRLHWNGSGQQPSEIMADFKCSGGEEYRVFSPSSLPPRCHYASRVVGDVIFEGGLGTTFYLNAKDDPMLTADHGYDYLHSPMHAIFYARGPSIRPKTMLPPFQNIDYYHFFEDLLGMRDTSHVTNGTRGMLDAALVNPPERLPEEITLLSECPRIRADASALPCRRCTNVERTALDTLFKSLGDTTTVNAQLGVDTANVNRSEFCFSPFHDIVVAAPRHSKNGTRVFVEALSLTGLRSFPGISGNCSFEHARYEDACSGERPPPGFDMTSLLAGNASAFSGISKSEVPLHVSFKQAFLTPLQTLTHEYLRRYGRLLSFTGTIFDYDTDGRADESVNSSIPSHIFRVLLSCRHWATDSSCASPEESAVMAWIIPHIEEDFNCLPPVKLLLSYTARVRDVELATGIRFFADRRIIPEHIAKSIASFIPNRLW